MNIDDSEMSEVMRHGDHRGCYFLSKVRKVDLNIKRFRVATISGVRP